MKSRPKSSKLFVLEMRGSKADVEAKSERLRKHGYRTVIIPGRHSHMLYRNETTEG